MRYLLALLLLSGCGLATADQRSRVAASFRAGPACRAEVGREPYAGLNLFGAAGALVMASTDEHEEWHRRYADCMERKVANG